MNKRLVQRLALMCALALLFSFAAALTLAEGTQARVVRVEWKDGNNRDGLRPASLSLSLAGQTVELNEENHWA